MALIDFIKPQFWDYQNTVSDPYKQLFDFRKIWKETIFISICITLFPLICLTMFDYTVTQRAVESEALLRTARLASNTRRSVSFFISERKFALDFIIHDNSYSALTDPVRLRTILENLQKGLGGFSDLGIIDSKGRQHTYVGSFNLEGVDYSTHEWFNQIMNRGVYISEVFLGLRNLPHFVIAVKHSLPDGSFYILRATLEMERLKELLSGFEVSGEGDMFIINKDGMLQTPSKFYGNVHEKIPLPVPAFSEKTQVIQSNVTTDHPLVIGYAYIIDTPFILMIVKEKNELLKHWFETRAQLISLLLFTIFIIICVILWIVTYLVNVLHISDQKRLNALHSIEYSNKMATIGRLAAGVAHEINNPLAIINEKAGLLLDIFTYTKQYANDQKLIDIANSIIYSVERCSTITQRLLSFARHSDIKPQPVEIKSLITEVIGFLGKEAEYRSIEISLDIDKNIPTFECVRGKLQQILLNIIKNAFAAVEDGGHIKIAATPEKNDKIKITICDDGCGIRKEDLEHIFEPFFTTKAEQGGTGLGLSITYSLVQEMNGTIHVESEQGKGTCFHIILPIKQTL